MLTKDDILKSRDFQVKTINVPEWGGDIHYRNLTAAQGTIVVSLAENPKADRCSMFQRVVAFSLCDSDGKRLFTDEDHVEIAKKNFDVVLRVATAILEHSGINLDDADDAEKN